MPVIMLSNLDDNDSQDLIKIIKNLGGMNTNSPRHCTHLVMSQLSRTDKFIQCLPVVKHVLRTDWLVDCGSAGVWIKEEGYEISDSKVEDKFEFNLAETLATKNRDKLFLGKTFYLTPNVEPSIEILTNIIECSGGR